MSDDFELIFDIPDRVCFVFQHFTTGNNANIAQFGIENNPVVQKGFLSLGKLFGNTIIGLTKIGKSPLAAHLARALGLAAISGSEWVKARCTPPMDNMTGYVAALTSYTCRTLAEVGDASLVPKIEPLLSDPNKKVQEDARDAIATLKNRVK